MAEHEQAPHTAEDAQRARRQLLIKGAVAGVIVVVLVVVLAMIEGQHEEAPAPNAHTVTSTGVTGQPEAQSPSLAEATTEALRKSSEAAELQSVVMAEQQTVASAAAAAPVVPEESTEPLGVPAPASEPKAASSRQHASGRLVLEQSPPRSARTSASSSSVAAPVAAPAKAAAPLTSAANPVVAPAGFVVQVGVFTNPGNAEELRAKLKAAGIPTQVETRVQVGPFKSRQEAVEAQARLKSLGLDSGMVIPAKR